MLLFFRTFRSRNYRLFFAGQFLSLSGTWMSMMAMGWLVYRLTGDPFMLGMQFIYVSSRAFDRSGARGRGDWKRNPSPQ